MNKIIPNWWSILLGLAMSLFVIQPYSYHFRSIPAQVIIVWVLIAWAIIFRKRIVTNSISSFSIFQRLLVICILTIFLYKTIIGSVSYLILFQICTGIIIAILSCMVCTQKKSLKIVMKLILFTAALSAFVALLQYLGHASWTWKYTIYYGKSIHMPSGLEFYPVSLSYSLIAPCMILLITYLFEKSNKIKLDLIPKFISLPYLVIILFSFILSQSRSGALSIIVGAIISIMIFIRLKKRFIPFSILTILIVLFSIVYFTKENIFKGIIHKTEQIGSDMRTEGTWSIFLPVIIEYPFGVPKSVIGKEQSNKLKIIGGYSNKNYKEAMKQTQGYDPHNLIITAAVYFGVPVAILLLTFYINLFFVGYKEIFLCRKDFNKHAIYVLILFSTNLALVVHAWFHNASIIFGEMRLWFWVGLLIGYIKLAMESRFNNLSKTGS